MCCGLTYCGTASVHCIAADPQLIAGICKCMAGSFPSGMTKISALLAPEHIAINVRALHAGTNIGLLQILPPLQSI